MLFTQPTPPEDALNFANKVLVGSPLTSSEWQDVPVELRTRAFFSSEVESVQFLQRARGAIQDFLANNRESLPDGQTVLKTGSRAQFVDQMQKFLEANGVVRTSGDLKDITSQSRLSLIFNTQVSQAYGYGYYKSGMTPALLNAYPGWRFIRVKAVKEPRLNHEQYEGKVFLKTDPIWARVINKDFGVPWPPFGWGCGHDVQAAPRSECVKLGLIGPKEQLTPDKKYDFNSGLQASIKNLDEDLIAKLKQVFGDNIIIEGDTMRWAYQGQSGPAIDLKQPLPFPIPAATVERSAPVSAAVNIQTTKAAATTVRQVLSLIDRVHDDGELEPLILNHHISAGSQGTYYSGANSIGIRRTGAANRELTIAHEIGHWLDDQALPGESFSSQFSPALSEWRQAVMNSEAIKNLTTLAGYQNNSRYRAYLLRGREVWARAYAQYIATRSGDATMLQQVQSILDGTSGGYWRDSQWTAEDFKPIAEVMDKLFKKLGWL